MTIPPEVEARMAPRIVRQWKAVALSSPHQVQHTRGPKDGTGAASGPSSILTRTLVVAMLAGHEQATYANAAERLGTDWFLILDDRSAQNI